jgi:hypothetical protein
MKHEITPWQIIALNPPGNGRDSGAAKDYVTVNEETWFNALVATTMKSEIKLYWIIALTTT